MRDWAQGKVLLSAYLCTFANKGEKVEGKLLEGPREVKFRAVFCCMLASVTNDTAFWETSTVAFLDSSHKPAQKIKSPVSRQSKLVKIRQNISHLELGRWVGG